MDIDVEMMRQDYNVYGEVLMFLRHGGDYPVYERPICQWGGKELIVVGEIDLCPGRQELAVAAVEDLPPIARFANRWPEIEYLERRYAVVIHLDYEAVGRVLLEDGTTSQDIWWPKLSIRVEPDT